MPSKKIRFAPTPPPPHHVRWVQLVGEIGLQSAAPKSEAPAAEPPRPKSPSPRKARRPSRLHRSPRRRNPSRPSPNPSRRRRNRAETGSTQTRAQAASPKPTPKPVPKPEPNPSRLPKAGKAGKTHQGGPQKAEQGEACARNLPRPQVGASQAVADDLADRPGQQDRQEDDGPVAGRHHEGR